MRLIQFLTPEGQIKVGIVENEKINVLKNVNSTYHLFSSVLPDNTRLEDNIYP
jgi:hypothetical protein